MGLCWSREKKEEVFIPKKKRDGQKLSIIIREKEHYSDVENESDSDLSVKNEILTHSNIGYEKSTFVPFRRRYLSLEMI